MTLYCCCLSQQYKLQLSELLGTCAACGTAQTKSLRRKTADHRSANSTSKARTGSSEGNTATNCSYRHIQHKQQRRLFAVHQVVSQQAVNETHLNIRICTHVTACATVHNDCAQGDGCLQCLSTGNVCNSWIQSQAFHSNGWGP